MIASRGRVAGWPGGRAALQAADERAPRSRVQRVLDHFFWAAIPEVPLRGPSCQRPAVVVIETSRSARPCQRPQDDLRKPLSSQPLMGMLGQQPGGSGTPVIRVNVETEHLAHGRAFLARAEVHESDDKSVSLGHQEVAFANQAAGKGSRPLMSSLLDGILQPVGREESREADPPRLGVCFPYRWRIRQSCVSDLHGSHSLSPTRPRPHVPHSYASVRGSGDPPAISPCRSSA